MRSLVAAMMVVAMSAAAPAALAQAGLFGEAYIFLKAVRDGDVLKAKRAIDGPGSTLVNTRDTATGETALHIVTRRRDAGWMRFLMTEGADVNARDKAGSTPLIVAVDQRFIDGARLLLSVSARVDEPNRDGETPLIKAVQTKDMALVRLLLENGADPDVTDNVAGYSARDYAKQDRRSSAIARMIEGVGGTAAAPGQAAATPPSAP